MNEQIRQALRDDLVIDITTVGRKSGEAKRIEIWFHNINDRLYITGMPGPRSWYANLLANPSFTFHLKQSIEADLPATALAITDKSEKRSVLAQILDNIKENFDGAPPAIETWVEKSPLIEVIIT
ncbi:MAG: nitroreductase/quinone reductase family protein [Chloroflexota bacterium]